MVDTIDWCEIHGVFVGERGKCPKCSTEPKQQPVPITTIIGGQDLAKHRDYSALVALEIIAKKARICGIKQWPHSDYRTVMAETRDIYRQKKFKLLGLDQNAMGEPVMEMYQSMGLKVEGVRFTLVTKAEMVELLRALLDSGQLEIPRHGGPLFVELRTQIKEQEVLIGASENPRFEHPTGRHDDLFWALAISCYVARPWLTANQGWVVRLR